MKKNDISAQAFNALSELGNIGAGNAATSLSVLLSSKLEMSVPTVAIYDFNELENILGGADSTVVGVLSTIEGDMNAMMLFVVNLEDAQQMVKVLLKDDTAWHSDMGLSAINEIANIIMASYVSSLETLSGLKIRRSIPQICIDMAGSILSVPCIEFGKVSDYALLIESSFKAGDCDLNGFIMMVSETHSFDSLLNRLGIGGLNE